MESAYYELKRIPDLSLSKYSALDESGVEGVLKKHMAFLRQLHRKGLLSHETIHWIYEYNPDAEKGKRLKIVLKFDSPKISEYMESFMASSPLSPFFDLVRVYPETELPPLNEAEEKKQALRRKDLTLSLSAARQYRYQTMLIKKEKFAKPDNPDMLDFYSVNKWEMNEDARLFGLFTMMRSVNMPCVYCVEMVPVDYVDVVESPNMLGQIMRELRRMLSLRVEKSSGVTSFQKDESADYTLDRYKELIKDIAANPHFNVNIKAYADSAEYAGMLLDTAASEALDEGSHDIMTGSGYFSLRDIMDSGLKLLCNRNTPKELRFWPTLFMLKELSPFAVFPALYPGESVEIPKETAPNYHADGLFLGEDTDKFNVYFPLKNLSKHAFMAGVPGSGKTNSMMHIASTLYKDFSIPFLILEPAKQEYRALVNQPGMEGMTVFSPSSGTRFPLHINPFEFPLGMSLAEHIRRVITVFEGAFFLEAPMPFLLDGAIEEVYRDKNWLPYTINNGTLKYPTMSELYKKLEDKLKKTDYSDEIKSNIKSALQVRIGSLITREMGDVFDVSYSTIAPEEWLRRSAVIELESMGSDPANFLTLMLATLIRESLKANPLTENDNKSQPRHVIFFEEAHNLIGPQAEENAGEKANPKTAATAFIVKMLAEVRALNEAIVIADQLPTAMAPEVIKNTSLKLGHRMTSQDDRQLLGSTMSADEVQLERMATYTTGNALAIYEGLLKPFELKMAQWAKGSVSTLSPSDDALYEKLSDSGSPFLEDLQRSYEITIEKTNAVWNRLDTRKETLLRALDYRTINEARRIECVKKLENSQLPDQERYRAEELIERIDGRLTSEWPLLIDEFNALCDAQEEVIFGLCSYRKQNAPRKREIENEIMDKLQAYREFSQSVKGKSEIERSPEDKARRDERLKQWIDG